MLAYFNLRHLRFLSFGLKYGVKIWLKYTHIFTLCAASYLSCALRLLASISNAWTIECSGTALPQTSEDSCKHSRMAASLLLCFSPSVSRLLAYSSAWAKEVCGTASARTKESLLQKRPEAFSLMDNRRRACQRPRTRYTKDGPFKESGLPASRHLVFYFLAEVTCASRPCCFYLLVFSPRRFKQPYGVYANGQKKAGAPNAREPNIQKKARLGFQGFLLLGFLSFVSNHVCVATLKAWCAQLAESFVYRKP